MDNGAQQARLCRHIQTSPAARPETAAFRLVSRPGSSDSARHGRVLCVPALGVRSRMLSGRPRIPHRPVVIDTPANYNANSFNAR